MGEVRVQVGAYNPAHTLVLRLGTLTQPRSIQNLSWSTYYGGDDFALYGEIDVNNNDHLFHTMQISGGMFISTRGENTRNSGGSDVLISKFDHGAHREWATFFGGTASEGTGDIIASGLTSAFVVGGTGSANLPVLNVGNAYFQNTHNGGGDAFILEIDQPNGYRQWATYFGGAGIETASGLALDAGSNTLAICGYTTSAGTTTCSAGTAFPLCNGFSQSYFQTTHAGNNGDAYIAQFELNSKKLKWTTFFGGDGNDEPYDIQIYNPTGHAPSADLYLCGSTTSDKVPANTVPPLSPPTNGEFPLTGASPAYFQTHFGSASPTGFLAQFSPNRELRWSSYFGGGNFLGTKLHHMALTASGDLYAVGSIWLGVIIPPTPVWPIARGTCRSATIMGFPISSLSPISLIS